MSKVTVEQLLEFADQVRSGRVSRESLQDFLDGKLKGAFPCLTICPELIPDWCKEIVEDVAPTDFKVSDLEFVPFLNEGETQVKGPVMREKAVVLKANFGLSDGKRLLAEQDKIPTELRGRCYIVLAGTVLRGSDGDLYVAYLYCYDDRWCLHFYGLGFDWYGGDRLPRRK